jgi:hypothetical protein
VSHSRYLLRFPLPAGRMARATRAYLAGIGTSGSLLAGAALMFIVASALVAFRGWPHVAAQPSPGEVVVSPQASASPATPVARRLVLATAAAAGGRIGARAPATRAPGGRGVVPRGRVTAPATSQSIGTPATTSRPVSAPSVPSSGARSAPSVPSGCALGGCGSSPAPAPTGPVKQVVQTVGGTLGGVVSGAGTAAGSTVQQTTSTVGGAVSGVSPQVGGTVTQVGSGAANVIGGVTKTVSGVLSGIGK